MARNGPLIILLNGPLGIGKSTFGEVLGEAIERSVTLDGDSLAALNPPPADEIASLHATIALLFSHHLGNGFDRFIVNHYWSSPAQMADLEERLRQVAPSAQFRWFRLTLSKQENLRRIALRQSTRAIDEADFEAEHFAEEYATLSAVGGELGEPFDVSGPPDELGAQMLSLLQLGD
jgi:hypothetical protein